jgi:hypothetical protein
MYRVGASATVFVPLAMLLLLLTPAPAGAWWSGGHRVIANIAYDQLDQDSRAEIVRILRKHLRFAEEFASRMPDEIRNGNLADQDRWIFLQGSLWPDLIRGKSKDFDRPTWHYIDLPYFLNEEDREALAKVEDIFPKLELPAGLAGDYPQGLNVIQALKFCSARLADHKTPDATKAVYVCWLLHLTGDLHQPLHSTGLYSRGRFFASGGDQGGNRIPTKQRRNLHMVWDSLLGDEMPLNEVRKRAQEITSDPDLKKAGEQAAASLQFDHWAQESHRICKEFVHCKQILDEVRAKEGDPNQKLTPIDLPESYLKEAGAVARRRAAQSGYRLAALLKKCLMN